jgi:hypothetical protein
MGVECLHGHLLALLGRVLIARLVRGRNRAGARARVRARVRARIRARVRARVRAGARATVRARIRARIRARVRVRAGAGPGLGLGDEVPWWRTSKKLAAAPARPKVRRLLPALKRRT